jgi:thiol-disulfide isomerase/thioredoxin
MLAGLAHARPPSAALDFELASLSGGFVRLAELSARPTVVNFWRSDCPPCLRELPILEAFAAAHPEARVVAVAVQPRSMTESRYAAAPGRLVVLVGPREGEAIMRRFGATSSATPYTAVLRADRTLCARMSGEVTVAWLQARIGECATDDARANMRYSSRP